MAIRREERKREYVLPPQLYDLTEMQREMNRRYGFSAEATLQAAQSLYEAKLITYPRTDSRYLSDDLKRTIPDILRGLETLKLEEIGRLDLAALPFSGRIVNNSKVTDHHAIIPTGSPPGELKPRVQKIYDAVLTRLIAAFYPPCVKEVTTVEAGCNQVPFRARGVRIVSPGWTVLDPRTKTDEQAEQDEASQPLPTFRPGERGPHEPFVKRGETTPPKPFTENTLLGAMETAGKLVDDDQLKEALKQHGLGTPATRAAIIETLLKRGYIVRDKKSLAATDLGRYLAAVITDERLKSPELTGEWEARLREIEAGRLDPERFIAAIADYTREIVHRVQAPAIDSSKIGDCPCCGRPVVEGKRDFGCSGCPLCGSEVVEQKQSYRCGNWRAGCPVTIWKTVAHKRLTPNMVKTLLKKGRTSVLKGFKSKAGKAFSACLKLVDGEVRLDFEN